MRAIRRPPAHITGNKDIGSNTDGAAAPPALSRGAKKASPWCPRGGGALARRRGSELPKPPAYNPSVSLRLTAPLHRGAFAGGHEGRPYTHAPGFTVGAGFIPARIAAPPILGVGAHCICARVGTCKFALPRADI